MYLIRLDDASEYMNIGGRDRIEHLQEGSAIKSTTRTRNLLDRGYEIAYFLKQS